MSFDLNPWRQGYLFTVPNELKMGRLLHRPILFPARETTQFTFTYFDTPDNELERNGFQAMHLSGRMGAYNLQGIEYEQYSTDNIWKTQSRRLMGWNSKIGGKAILADNPALDRFKALETPASLKVEEKYNEAIIQQYNNTDIGICKYDIPQAKLSYIRIFSTNASKNAILAHENKQFERHERRNFLGVQRFIENCFDRGLIKPMTEMPVTIMRKKGLLFE